MTILICIIIAYLAIAVILLWLSSFSGKLTLRDYKDSLAWLPILIKLLRE
jgi:hypothetical protein